MNAPNTTESTALTVATQQTSALMLSPALMQQMMAVAQSMSEAAVTVPQHFRGKPGDCLAVVMQATQWNMNPYAVAQKTHVVNGTLGYEAQLVHAVLQATGAIEGTFSYEYRGEAAALECRVGAVCRGDTTITWGEWLSATQVTTKNSPLWKTNPRQQIGYLQVKNWARAFKPGAILGVYTTDELEAAPREKNMGHAEVVPQGSDAAKPAATTGNAQPEWTDAELAKREGKIREFYGKGKTAEDIIAFYSTKAVLSDAQQQRIRALAPTAQAQDVTPKAISYAQVAEHLNAAADIDALNVAADLINQIPDSHQQSELTEIYETRKAELEGATA